MGGAPRRGRGAAARLPALVRRRAAGRRHPGADPRRVRSGRHHRPAAAGGRRPARGRIAAVERHGCRPRRGAGRRALHVARRDALRPGRTGGRPRRRRRPARPADRRRGGGAGRRRRARRRRPPHAAADVGLRHPPGGARPVPHRAPAAVRRRGRAAGRAASPGRRLGTRGSDPGHRGHPVRRGAAPVLRPDDVQPGVAGAVARGQPVPRQPRRLRRHGLGDPQAAAARGPAHVRGRPARRQRPARHPDRLRAHRRGGGGLRAGAQAPGPRGRRAGRVRRRDAQGDAGRQLHPLHGHRPHGGRPTTAPASATRTRGCGACPAWCWPATA